MAFELILGRKSKAASRIGFSDKTPHDAGGELITYGGEGHLMTFAPTGTGKTSGPVICNALRHRGQLIVIDIKGEIYAATAQARRDMGQDVHALDMRDANPLPGSLNPMELLALSGTDPTAIARGFAAELIERGAAEKDRFWNDHAETLIAAAATWLLADNPENKRQIGSIHDLFSGDDVVYQLATLLDKEGEVREKSSRNAIAAFLQTADLTRSGILSTTQSHLRLFDSATIRRLTDTSSFDVAAFIEGKPMSLYIIVPPLRLNAYRPVLRLWLSSLILALTQRTTLPKERTLMLCDEMGNLGRIDALLTAATLMRSWGLTLWTFWQNVSQLQIYGTQANTLIDNAGVIQAFGARNLRMAQDFANIVGGISAEQIMKMKPDEQLLLVEGKNVFCKQARYYSDALFLQNFNCLIFASHILMSRTTKLPFTFRPNSKFALIALDGLYTEGLETENRLADGTWVLPGIPAVADLGTWEGWIGSHRADSLKRANLVLIIDEESDSPAILDDANIRLRDGLAQIYSFVRMRQGVELFGSQEPDLLTGACLGDMAPLIRQMTKMSPFFESRGYLRAPITMARLEEAYRLRNGLREMQSTGEFERFFRGLNVLFDGLKATGQNRLHQFVRSLEALIIPDVGKTARQFIHRCQTFTLAGDAAVDALKAAFEMRSDAEHLHSWERAVMSYPSSERDDVCWQRTRQMQSLACDAYSRILLNPEIRLHFRTEESLEAFWKLGDHATRSIWGKPLNITTEPVYRKHDQFGRPILEPSDD